MAYIYQIVNDVNGKIYIGKTQFDIQKRFKEHCKDAFRERNEKRPLYAAMRKYGIEHFHIELLEETDNPEEREIYWIEQMRAFKNGYNATMGGDGKKYIDYDLIEALYKETGNAQKVAEITGYDCGHIRNILKNKGYDLIKISHESTSKMIAKCDKNTGEIIEVFSSLAEAARSINKHRFHLNECVAGKRKSAYGYAWKHIN